MDIKYTSYGTGEKKILIDVNMLQYYEIEYQLINKDNDYTFYFLERGQFTSFFKHTILNNVPYKRLDNVYKNNLQLKKYYEKLLELSEQHKITHFLFTSTGQYWHPEFLQKLKKKGAVIALSTADDDTSRIKSCSLPYTKYYDYHFHVGVMYDKRGKTIADKLREYGGNPIWIPLGARADHLNDEINYINRDIDVCYIGNVNPPKLFRLSKLKRHFGDRFKLYGGQGNGDRRSLKGIFYKITNKIFRLGYVEAISEEKLLDIYRRTKIGFNMHLVPWKGPSNSRMYELPCNGVMQLCDDELGMKRVFENGKEIVCYDNIKDAIKKIEYYLKHDEERIKIAEAGHKRAIEEYQYYDVLKKILNMILK